MNQITRWRPGAETWVLITGMLVLPLLAIEFAAILGFRPTFFAYDEIEHLSVMFAIERGERPYLDFFENHPLLPHLLLSALRRLAGLEDVGRIRQMGLVLVLLHAAGCFLLLKFFFSRFAAAARLSLPPTAMLWVALGLLTFWQDGEHFLALVWQLRPDWACYFWALLGIFLHYRLHEHFIRAGRWSSFALAGGGLASGFALALMGKAVFFFIPYLLVIWIIVLVDFHALATAMRGRWWPLFAVNLSFVVLALATFAACVALELHLTGSSAAAYYRANFTLNGVRHHVATILDAKLFDIIFLTVDGHLSAVLIEVTLIMALLLRVARERNDRLFGLYALLAVMMVVLINGLLPAFSNGGPWAQYYIPALLMLLFLTAAALGEGWRLIERVASRINQGHMLRLGVGLIFCAVFLGTLHTHYGEAINRLENVPFSAKLLQLRTNADEGGALPDIVLPANLSYLSFDPNERPARGKLWGYYFMLPTSLGLWGHVYRLGLGPDPATHWRNLWRHEPPDVVLVHSASDLANRIRQVASSQGIDLTWMREALRRDYVCLRRGGFVVTVRRERLAHFVGWQECDFYIGSATVDWQRP